MNYRKENCKTELIANYPCHNKEEVRRRENFSYRKTECVKRCVAKKNSRLNKDQKTVRTWGSPTTSQSCSCGSAKTMVNTIVSALSHVNKDVLRARTYFKYVRASTASCHDSSCLKMSVMIFMSINSWTLFDKLETMRFVSQNHGVSKNNGIYHGFGTWDDCADAVSQPFFLFMLGRCGVLSFPQSFWKYSRSKSKPEEAFCLRNANARNTLSKPGFLMVLVQIVCCQQWSVFNGIRTDGP